MMKVIDGVEDVFVPRYLFWVDSFIRCDLILVWLIQNRKVGKEFKSFVENEFKGSAFQMSKWVLAQIDKNKEAPVSIARKELV